MTPDRPPAAEPCCPVAPSASPRIRRPHPAAGRQRCWPRRARETDPFGQSSRQDLPSPPSSASSGLATGGSNTDSFPTSLGAHGFNWFGAARPMCGHGTARARVRLLDRRGSGGPDTLDGGDVRAGGPRAHPAPRVRRRAGAAVAAVDPRQAGAAADGRRERRGRRPSRRRIAPRRRHHDRQLDRPVDGVRRLADRHRELGGPAAAGGQRRRGGRPGVAAVLGDRHPAVGEGAGARPRRPSRYTRSRCNAARRCGAWASRSTSRRWSTSPTHRTTP